MNDTTPRFLISCAIALLTAAVLCSCDQSPRPKTTPRTAYPPDPSSSLYKYFVDKHNRLKPYVGKRLWYIPSPEDSNWFKFYTNIPDYGRGAPDFSFRITSPTSFEVIDIDDSNGGFAEAFAKIQLADKVAYVESSAFANLSWKSRLDKHDRLQLLAPEDQLKADVVNEAADKAAEIRKVADAKIAEKNDKQRRKKEGVSIGMTKEQVLASNWGRPQSVNKTTSTYGIHEQWVYGGGYLYFQDGKLTTIQN